MKSDHRRVVAKAIPGVVEIHGHKHFQQEKEVLQYCVKCVGVLDGGWYYIVVKGSWHRDIGLDWVKQRKTKGNTKGNKECVGGRNTGHVRL